MRPAVPVGQAERSHQLVAYGVHRLEEVSLYGVSAFLLDSGWRVAS
jgi:hypothetical protein